MLRHCRSEPAVACRRRRHWHGPPTTSTIRRPSTARATDTRFSANASETDSSRKGIVEQPWLAAAARDMKVEASAIQPQNGRHLSILVRKARGPFVGQDGILRPSGTRPSGAGTGHRLATHKPTPQRGGLPTRRRMPSCPTKSRRFHFHVAHPKLTGPPHEPAAGYI